MEIIRIPKIMQDSSRTYSIRGKSIGFVPTMGALHEGHLALVRISKQENDITVASIYLNPTQFGPSEDLTRYPRDLEGDTKKLREMGVDILFLPDDAHIYLRGFSTQVEVKGLSEKLCGVFRPGHFSAVATVVTKLFNIVKPERAYFGQKDFQQAIIIKRLVRDLDMGIGVETCPTIREADGLAMSSRNLYLSLTERKAATVIYRALLEASEAIRSGTVNAEAIKKGMLDKLASEPLVSEVQYCSVYDPETLDELEVVDKEALLAVALKLGATRLIDNMLAACPK